MRRGLVAPQGLIAQGRGEAFDYLLGERTILPARRAERAAAAHLILARHPVVSVNGNVTALAAKDVVKLAKAVPAKIEINLFYRTEARVRRIASRLEDEGAKEVLGVKPDARIPGLESKRSLCARDGIYSSDVVLVPLEDGDRTEALARMGKIVLAVDLNPMSRTSMAATVTVVDELTRALPNIIGFVKSMKGHDATAGRVVKAFDNNRNLAATFEYIRDRLGRLAR
jgi:4-phosphopantoate--beta-alanine ligase